jgi:Mn-dependent DtxR family transcriptional regulator
LLTEWKRGVKKYQPLDGRLPRKTHLMFEMKGYARVVDIAASLDVLPSSVTKMMQNLDEQGFGVYERYRGFMLTEKRKL